MPADRPIITLTTDFGLRDAYVATMKAAVLRHCPQARLIDVTHDVPPQDVLCGSIALERAVAGFDPGTTHLVVIDPGVGTSRRMLVVRLKGQHIVCPDNGLITWAWRMHGAGQAHELTWRPDSTTSTTFHGRDIMGPVAGMLARGAELSSVTRPIDDPILLDLSPATEPVGVVIHLDRFGNATTNIPRECLAPRPKGIVHLRGQPLGPVMSTYSDVGKGNVLALIGSSGLLEIAVRDGSAAANLNVQVGDEVVVR